MKARNPFHYRFSQDAPLRATWPAECVPNHILAGALDNQEETQGQRIGDKIKLTGVSIKFMTELNERYSDVTFRCLIVKAAKGDVPTWSTLVNGLSGNKMRDKIKRER